MAVHVLLRQLGVMGTEGQCFWCRLLSHEVLPLIRNYVAKLMEGSQPLLDIVLVEARLPMLEQLSHLLKSCFMEDPREDHWAAVKRLLRYIKRTVDQGIIFPKTGGSGLQLTVFSNADLVGDIDGWWSTSGVLVFLRSAPISWLSLK